MDVKASNPAGAGGGYPRLVADIGGTNARFGWVEAGHGVQHVRTIAVRGHAGPGEAIRAYLQQLAPDLGRSPDAPREAAIAVATTVSGDHVAFTNCPWSFSRSALQSDLGLERLLVLNDFEALALSLPHLGPAQLRAHGALPAARGTLAVVGPGTGLGVAGLVQTPSGWQAIPGEGGHATVSAADDFEAEVLARARRSFGHVSAERLLSGIGLPVLYRAVCEVIGEKAGDPSTEEIVARGLAAGDPACARTLDTFCDMLGSFCGNVALVLGARGGVFLGGGILPRLGDRFFASRFRERFEEKGRFREYLRPIPTALITDTLAALSGAAAALE